MVDNGQTYTENDTLHVTKNRKPPKYLAAESPMTSCCNKYEEKESKCQCHCEYNKNVSEEQKQKQVEYMRNYHLTHKNKLFNRLLRFF